MPGRPPFDFATAGRIVFGWDRLQELPKLAAGFGSRVLLVCGSKPKRIQPCLQLLEQNHCRVECFQVLNEPSIDTIEAGSRKAREGFDWVLGMGGGSVLDAAKAIAIMTRQSGEVMDYLEVIGHGKPFQSPGLPMVAVPTTAGTGSEVTRNAVLSSNEHKVKVSMRHPSMLPDMALVDPALTVSCPPTITAATGLDALTQLIEPFLSCKANPMTDAFCRQGIPLAAQSIRTVVEKPEDKQARTDMALASLLGGLALANAGLGAVHGIAGPFGGMFPGAPHGAICAALLPGSLEVNHRVIKDRHPDHACLQRFDELARMINGEAHASFESMLNWVVETIVKLNIPGLGTYGFSNEHLPDLIQKSKNASSIKGNPIELTHNEIQTILQKAV
jgi:alcohol dehydrogenase class IV